MGHGSVCAYRVGNEVSQDELEPVDRGHAQKGVTLIDHVEHRSDDERDVERAARHAFRYGTDTCELTSCFEIQISGYGCTFLARCDPTAQPQNMP
jgi:hypothetical protein